MSLIIEKKQPLPDDIYEYEFGKFFYRIDKEGTDEQMLLKYLAIKRTMDIRTIKNCMVFLVAIGVILLLGSIFIGLRL